MHGVTMATERAAAIGEDRRFDRKTASSPGGGAAHGGGGLGGGGQAGRAVIERHGDVGAEGGLDAQGLLGGEQAQ